MSDEFDYTDSPAHKPGSYRYSYMNTGKVWGSVEEQVKEAQRYNLESTSSRDHVLSQSYAMECEHVNPNDEERFDDVWDRLWNWMERNCNMTLSWGVKTELNSDIWVKNIMRAWVSDPVCSEFHRLEKKYYDTHNSGGLCLEEPMGLFCEGCQESGWEDYGVETGGCKRREQAREAYEDFWYLFSDKN